MITQKELKELLHYDPETGVFMWVVLRQGVRNGGVAGSMSYGYIRIKVKGRSYQAHRLAWLSIHGKWPKEQIDHINHIRDDNRIENLREATNQENQRNASMKKNNKSGITGVYWYKRDNKWLAYIMTGGKLINLGYFTDKFEAICARKSAEKKYGYHENHGVKK